ncbi:MAG TPA: DUF2203 domain-containing protein [Thermomicrobiales bacterium]
MSEDGNGAPERPRLFTLEEANALLPRIAPILEELQAMKAELDTARLALAQFTPAMRSNGHGVEALAHERQIANLVAKLSQGLREIAGLGVEVKDLDHGIVDFPSRRGDRIVYLCWRLGEERIRYWHELDAGFSGRQPL